MWFSDDAIACFESGEGAVEFWLQLDGPLGPPPKRQTILHTPAAQRMHRVTVNPALAVQYLETTLVGPSREVSVNIAKMIGALRLFVAFTWSPMELGLYVGDAEDRVGLLSAKA